MEDLEKYDLKCRNDNQFSIDPNNIIDRKEIIKTFIKLISRFANNGNIGFDYGIILQRIIQIYVNGYIGQGFDISSSKNSTYLKPIDLYFEQLNPHVSFHPINDKTFEICHFKMYYKMGEIYSGKRSSFSSSNNNLMLKVILSIEKDNDNIVSLKETFLNNVENDIPITQFTINNNNDRYEVNIKYKNNENIFTNGIVPGMLMADIVGAHCDPYRNNIKYQNNTYLMLNNKEGIKYEDTENMFKEYIIINFYNKIKQRINNLINIYNECCDYYVINEIYTKESILRIFGKPYWSPNNIVTIFNSEMKNATQFDKLICEIMPDDKNKDTFKRLHYFTNNTVNNKYITHKINDYLSFDIACYLNKGSGTSLYYMWVSYDENIGNVKKYHIYGLINNNKIYWMLFPENCHYNITLERFYEIELKVKSLHKISNPDIILADVFSKCPVKNEFGFIELKLPNVKELEKIYFSNKHEFINNNNECVLVMSSNRHDFRKLVTSGGTIYNIVVKNMSNLVPSNNAYNNPNEKIVAIGGKSINYHNKYLKYKKKYIKLQTMIT